MTEHNIMDGRDICTTPGGTRLVVVKAENNEPGLDSLGCATFTQRPLTVVTAIERYLKPFLVGHPASDIEDRHQSAYLSSY